jgi:DNA polymerase epsilon subunit 3
MAESAKIFIHYLTATANDACRDAKRSTISADDVLRAVEDIEFADFVEPLQASLEGFKKENARKKEAVGGKRKAKDTCVRLPLTVKGLERRQPRKQTRGVSKIGY